MPLHIQRDFVSALGKPLGTDEKLPPPQDLHFFWERCERAVRGLSTAFTINDLNDPAISELAPLILGQAAWATVKDAYFPNWKAFKDVVGAKYGMTEQ